MPRRAAGGDYKAARRPHAGRSSRHRTRAPAAASHVPWPLQLESLAHGASTALHAAMTAAAAHRVGREAQARDAVGVGSINASDADTPVSRA